MICIFNTSIPGERMIALDDVAIRCFKMDQDGKPYIMFDHKDYPLGSLRADFDGEVWCCDLD